MSRISVAIIGATGYTGSELVRLLMRHPSVELTMITSESRAGEKFSDVHPAFHGLADMELQPMEAVKSAKLDLVFLALPHRVSMNFVRDFGVDKFKVVDLSGDFRLRERAVYEEWYSTEHVAPDHLSKAAYGLPELYREKIKSARLVANPGCYPTSAILALAPLVQAGLIETSGIVVDSKSGVTGAGAKARANTHFPGVFGNFNAYGLLKHRHAPEMEQALADAGGAQVRLLFTPHLLPIDRGILSTCYATPVKEVSADMLQRLYRDYYAKEPFVRVLERAPAVKDVRGSNYCDVFVTYDPRTKRILALGAIDNLVKGAAGAAVQNMNLMFGWEETTGLEQGPLTP